MAGLGAAVLLVAGAAGFAWLAGGKPRPISAGADITRLIALADASDHADDGNTLTGLHDPFAEGPVDGVTLPGVSDTATFLSSTAPTASGGTGTGPRAPLPGLYEPGPGGPLPVIAADGRRPDQVYARPFDGLDAAPTVSVIVGGLGLSETLTRRAIEVLPAEITLGFAPYSDDLQALIDLARADGHEVLIELPMEPFDYPNNDPGPHTLLADASPEENQRRLLTLLSRAAGYAGVANYLGARFGASESAMTRLLEAIEGRGLTLYHDGAGRRPALERAREASGASLVLADRVIDASPDPDSIDARLLELEALALQNGTSLGSGFAYPATLETVAAWADGIEARGYQLAPASYVARLRAERDGPET